jgi:hypothetical protein
MDKFKALDVISRYVPEMSIRNALEMIEELNSLPQELTPFSWAEATFSVNDKNRKIAVIKEIRNRWTLSLRDAKEIADNMQPRSTVDFLPPVEPDFYA